MEREIHLNRDQTDPKTELPVSCEMTITINFLQRNHKKDQITNASSVESPRNPRKRKEKCTNPTKANSTYQKSRVPSSSQPEIFPETKQTPTLKIKETNVNKRRKRQNVRRRITPPKKEWHE